MRRCSVFVLVACTMGVWGCGAQRVLLGTENTYLFTVADGLALPEEEVPVSARLQGGDFLQPVAGQVVRFYRNGELIEAARTNDDGVATVSFTPAKAGEYFFKAEVAPTGLEDDPPSPQELMILAAPAETPMVVVDLDKTVVASGFHTVLIGDPEPMPESPEVLRKLSTDYQIVYLTHRPDYFSIKSKTWLWENDYPRAPVILSSVSGFLKGSGAFKGDMIRQLKDRFPGMNIGVGDKISDVLAYHDNGMRAFLIVQVPESSDPEEYIALAEDLEELPEEIHVVETWRQVEKGIYDGTSYPRSVMQEKLLALAQEAESEREDDEDD